MTLVGDYLGTSRFLRVSGRAETCTRRMAAVTSKTGEREGLRVSRTCSEVARRCYVALAGLLVLALACGMLSGCSRPEFVLRVDGQDVEFFSVWAQVEWFGGTMSKVQTFPVLGSFCSTEQVLEYPDTPAGMRLQSIVVFSQAVKEGTLRVTICRDGEVVAEDSASGPTDTIYLVFPPP